MYQALKGKRKGIQNDDYELEYFEYGLNSFLLFS